MVKKRLNVLGLSYSQTQTGAYALVLAEENGDRRIPIIIGGFEAQAIAIELEGLKPPRPLTHDLVHNFAKAFNIQLSEVNITKLEEGIFYSELLFNDGKDGIRIDARTSDAIALALRFGSPIFTSEDILSKAGIILEFDENDEQGEKKAKVVKEPTKTEEKTQPPKTKTASKLFDNLNNKELEDMLSAAIREENYERASLIKKELDRRKNS